MKEVKHEFAYEISTHRMYGQEILCTVGKKRGAKIIKLTGQKYMLDCYGGSSSPVVHQMLTKSSQAGRVTLLATGILRHTVDVWKSGVEEGPGNGE